MSRLLKSWATPPASVPTASSFCDCRSCLLALPQRLLRALTLVHLFRQDDVGARQLLRALGQLGVLQGERFDEAVVRGVQRAELCGGPCGIEAASSHSRGFGDRFACTPTKRRTARSTERDTTAAPTPARSTARHRTRGNRRAAAA